MDKEINIDRRFGGVRRLYGDQGIAQLRTAHVIVVGIGGVGTWAVEGLARNAIGRLTLIDLDHIAESNFNRQLHAVDGNEGKAKVAAMAKRVTSINPACIVNTEEDFVAQDNVADLLDSACDVVVDCVDDAKAKIAMAAYCQQHNVPLIMSGSAGGRLDAAKLKIADLAHVHGDKLLAKVRNQLRRDHGFPKASNHKKSARFGIQCVYSDEQVIKPNTVCDAAAEVVASGLNCAGYGSSVNVTAPFGFAAAQLAINQLLA